MRGRVAALYAMSFMGMIPWGSLLMGCVAGYTGVAIPVAVGGGVCVLGAIATWLDRRGDMRTDSEYSSWTRSEL
jgi:hypothetical protein